MSDEEVSEVVAFACFWWAIIDPLLSKLEISFIMSPKKIPKVYCLMNYIHVHFEF